MSDSKPRNLQERLERNIFGLFLATAFMVSIAGIVEIVPLFYLKSAVDYTEQTDKYGNLENKKFPELVWHRTFTVNTDGKLVSDKVLYKQDKNGKWVIGDWKPGDGVRPYTPLELAGRDIYLREGCYICHSQMIRPFRDERERYGHFSLATESIYDHPMQWGSKRTGPDLARVGGKYSDEWHVMHLMRPQDMVPESVMPAYPWLAENPISKSFFGTKRDMKERLKVMRELGVPYTDAEIANADKAVQGYTEMDALVAYLQVLGTMVKLDDSKSYRE
ncbi:cytochrome-c oxidase, cbb3-type subunit II [Hydrogenovibrio marinus]|uniref:Cytochrome oxidase subunit II n=1 Tax=Hydrogenovibrio marinus TaxID=28885 RepID=A0A066ZVL1_HYDMR|nr:cytochrome-c oxidase, cbb3-type subunit II [Hydrogenovibrio marinus]KDN96304.1 cytochrome oxidase subunit II [Hydrogenovibrio marinus]BBN60512.1 Cbb3-type cytochrome c oxidase subunit CcoO [Hydrogenovibrio marinus]